MCTQNEPLFHPLWYENLGAFLRAMPPIGDLVVRMTPIHCIDGIKVQQLPLLRMKKAYVVAGGILV